MAFYSSGNELLSAGTHTARQSKRCGAVLFRGHRVYVGVINLGRAFARSGELQI